MLHCFSHVQLFVTLWTVACQVSLSMGFFRQEYRNGLPCPLPVDLSNPGIEPVSLKSPALAGGFFTLVPPGKPIRLGTTLDQIDFPGGSEVKVSAWNVGNQGSIPGLGGSLGEGNGKPLQYSCLENPMEGGAW